MSETKAMFDAMTTKLGGIFATNLLHVGTPRVPIHRQWAAGVERIVEITETLRPTYDDPANIDVDLYYKDLKGKLRNYPIVGVTVDELLRHTGVRSPKHDLTWSVMQP